MKKAAKRAKAGDSPATVEAYLERFPTAVRKRLSQVRQTIQKAAPKTLEKIAYQMPAYQGRRILVYFAGYAHHIGFYPGAAAIAAFERELEAFVHAKGSVQFPHTKPLPLPLIRRLVAYRVAEDSKS
ncbi:MAG: DUF1801 domain-containing protein [Spirochaetes bacterium]|nr:DUF1801 domain-containing protein [Spirochaetota bacterium]